MIMKKMNFHLEVSKDDSEVAYLYLPTHPGRGTSNVVNSQISLAEKIDAYIGPNVYLDFDDTGCLIGIEVLM